MKQLRWNRKTLAGVIAAVGISAAGYAHAAKMQVDDFRGTDTSPANIEWDVSQHANTTVDVSEMTVGEAADLRAATTAPSERAGFFDSLCRIVGISDVLHRFSSTSLGSIVSLW